MNLKKIPTPKPSENSVAALAVASGLTPSAPPPVPTESWEAVRKLRELNPAVEYRPYPHAPQYIVSSDGNIYSTYYTAGNKSSVRIIREIPLRMSPRISGDYRAVGICVNKSIHKQVTLHILVLETFVGERPTEMHEGAHGNGNPCDNSLKNLRWATPKENAEDRRKHGRSLEGERHHNSKLISSQILEIRAMSKTGLAYPDIAKKYGVTTANICKIVLRQAWKHL